MTCARLFFLAFLLVAGTACSNNMLVKVRPPECTVGEKSPDCFTTPREPTDMTSEPFFQNKKK